MLNETTACCPYCGEQITLLADTCAGDSSYIEDCSVCCQPMLVSLAVDDQGNLASVDIQQENP